VKTHETFKANKNQAFFDSQPFECLPLQEVVNNTKDVKNLH